MSKKTTKRTWFRRKQTMRGRPKCDVCKGSGTGRERGTACTTCGGTGRYQIEQLMNLPYYRGTQWVINGVVRWANRKATEQGSRYRVHLRGRSPRHGRRYGYDTPLSLATRVGVYIVQTRSSREQDRLAMEARKREAERMRARMDALRARERETA